MSSKDKLIEFLKSAMPFAYKEYMYGEQICIELPYIQWLFNAQTGELEDWY